MSTLTLSVIALVTLVIGAVVLFNFWQSRANRREAERLFRQETGVLDEQAGIARRRRRSFSRPPAEDRIPGDDDATLPLYADGGYGDRDRTEPSLNDEGDWAAAVEASEGYRRAAGAAVETGPAGRARTDAGRGDRDDHGRRRDGDDPADGDDRDAVGSSEWQRQDERAAPHRPGSADRPAPSSSNGVPEVPLPEAIDPEQREALRRYAEDLRRVTARMPSATPAPISTTTPAPISTTPAAPISTAPAPPMSAKASVAPSADSGAVDPEVAYPARPELPPMAVSPAAAAVYQRDTGTDGESGVGRRDDRGGSDASRGAGGSGVASARTGAAGTAASRQTDAGAASPGASAADARPDDGEERVDHDVADAAMADGAIADDEPADHDHARRFPEVDLTVVLVPANPVNADRLIALASSLRHAGSKPIRLEIDRGNGEFVPLQSGVMATRLQLSVLLANRQGPLNAVELSDFMSALAPLAAQIGARFEPPDLNQVLGRARAVDTLAAELDTEVEIFVEAPDRLSSAQFATLGRRLGLYDRGGGRFACLNDGGEVLYLMTTGSRPDLVRFTLDVPRVAVDNDPWRSLVSCATRCAEAVGGRVVDSEGRGLSVGMIDAVSRQLARRYEQLANAGLAAGSSTALRVFN